MLNIISTEFLKLKRKKLIWLMLPSSLIMPFFALVFFNYFGTKGIEPIEFYKWSALGYTMWFILPFVLGMLYTSLMHDENKNDMLKQLWIVPVGKMEYFFSKFCVVLIYSICFMVITSIASVFFSVFSGYVEFDIESVTYIFIKCLEIGIITPFAMLPIFGIATSNKGYVLPICITLVYSFLSFFLMGINMYLHPITCMAVIIMRNRDIPGIIFSQEINVPFAFLCIAAWAILSVSLANLTLRKRK